MSVSLVIGAVAVLLGGLIQGCTGFGFGMIVLTPMLFLMEQSEAVPTILMLSMLNTTPVALRNRDKIRAELAVPLFASGVVGIPIGIAAVVALDGPVFRAGVGALLLLFALVLASGWTRPVKRAGLASIPVGFASGVMNGSTSMTGPPVIVFLANQDMPKDAFRATIVTHFSLMGLVAISLFAWRGMIDRGVLMQATVFAPMLILGTWAGVRVSRYVSEALFRKVTLVCAGTMGAVLFVRGLSALV